MDAPEALTSLVDAIKHRLSATPRADLAPGLRCRVGWHHWRRWTFARGDVLVPPQRDKQYRYCINCNYCEERPMGFFWQDFDVDRL
jgi:hypothetical protein